LIAANAYNTWRIIFGTGNVLTADNNISVSGGGHVQFYNGGIIEAGKNVTVNLTGNGSFGDQQVQ